MNERNKRRIIINFFPNFVFGFSTKLNPICGKFIFKLSENFSHSPLNKPSPDTLFHFLNWSQTLIALSKHIPKKGLDLIVNSFICSSNPLALIFLAASL